MGGAMDQRGAMGGMGGPFSLRGLGRLGEGSPGTGEAKVRPAMVRRLAGACPGKGRRASIKWSAREPRRAGLPKRGRGCWAAPNGTGPGGEPGRSVAIRCFTNGALAPPTVCWPRQRIALLGGRAAKGGRGGVKKRPHASGEPGDQEGTSGLWDGAGLTTKCIPSTRTTSMGASAGRGGASGTSSAVHSSPPMCTVPRLPGWMGVRV